MTKAIRIAPEIETADGERKTVTALFADIKGSTELMEDLDPEEARSIIDSDRGPPRAIGWTARPQRGRRARHDAEIEADHEQWRRIAAAARGEEEVVEPTLR